MNESQTKKIYKNLIALQILASLSVIIPIGIKWFATSEILTEYKETHSQDFFAIFALVVLIISSQSLRIIYDKNKKDKLNAELN